MSFDSCSELIYSHVAGELFSLLLQFIESFPAFVSGASNIILDLLVFK